MFIIAHRKFFFWLTGLILVAALGAIFVYGLPLGIDFTGGSLVQVDYPHGRPALSTVQEQLGGADLGTVSVRAVGDTGVSVRTRNLTEAEHETILSALSQTASTTELSYTSVGPALGSQFAS